MKQSRVIIAAVLCMFLIWSPLIAFAYSDSSEAKLPGTNWHLQSNVWQSNTYFWQTHSFMVSAKLFNGPVKNGIRLNAERISTSWSFKATGICVSVGNVSAGTPSGASFSGSWTNWNTWISDMSGTFKISGLPLYSNFTNTAFAIKSGTKATTTASCFRLY